MPDSDPTASFVPSDPSDLTERTDPPVTPGISRRQALAMGGGLAAAAAVMGAGPASAMTTAPPTTAPPTTAPPTTAPPTTAPPTTAPPTTPGIPGEPLTVQSITLEQAQAVLALAEGHAESIGVAMNIVIVDVCGDVKATSRQDGNGRASLVLAPLKAQTALAFRTATADLAANNTPERVATFQAAGFTTLGGGLPIRNAAGTAVIGAIGVGGGTPEQDIDVALVGLGQPPIGTAPPAAPTS